MVCPFCGHKDTLVYNSRQTAKLNNVWRRRRCESCHKTFTTTETIDPATVLRVKNGKLTEPFRSTTMLVSILRVCDHSPKPEEAADYIYQTVLQKLYRQAANGAQIINKADIVLTVLGTLKPYNLAAYVKYLSYHSPDMDARSLKKQLKTTS